MLHCQILCEFHVLPKEPECDHVDSTDVYTWIREGGNGNLNRYPHLWIFHSFLLYTHIILVWESWNSSQAEEVCDTLDMSPVNPRANTETLENLPYTLTPMPNLEEEKKHSKKNNVYLQSFLFCLVVHSNLFGFPLYSDTRSYFANYFTPVVHLLFTSVHMFYCLVFFFYCHVLVPLNMPSPFSATREVFGSSFVLHLTPHDVSEMNK